MKTNIEVQKDVRNELIDTRNWPVLKNNDNNQPDPPVKPEKDIPVKPDPNPDPTKQPEKNDPTRIDEPEKNDPTRIDDPPLTKQNPNTQSKSKQKP